MNHRECPKSELEDKKLLKHGEDKFKNLGGGRFNSLLTSSIEDIYNEYVNSIEENTRENFLKKKSEFSTPLTSGANTNYLKKDIRIGFNSIRPISIGNMKIEYDSSVGERCSKQYTVPLPENSNLGVEGKSIENNERKSGWNLREPQSRESKISTVRNVVNYAPSKLGSLKQNISKNHKIIHPISIGNFHIDYDSVDEIIGEEWRKQNLSSSSEEPSGPLGNEGKFITYARWERARSVHKPGPSNVTNIMNYDASTSGLNTQRVMQEIPKGLNSIQPISIGNLHIKYDSIDEINGKKFLNLNLASSSRRSLVKYSHSSSEDSNNPRNFEEKNKKPNNLYKPIAINSEYPKLPTSDYALKHAATYANSHLTEKVGSINFRQYFLSATAQKNKAKIVSTSTSDSSEESSDLISTEDSDLDEVVDEIIVKQSANSCRLCILQSTLTNVHHNAKISELERTEMAKRGEFHKENKTDDLAPLSTYEEFEAQLLARSNCTGCPRSRRQAGIG